MDYIDDTTTRSNKKEFIIDWNETDDWVSKLITEETLNLDIDQKSLMNWLGDSQILYLDLYRNPQTLSCRGLNHVHSKDSKKMRRFAKNIS